MSGVAAEADDVEAARRTLTGLVEDGRFAEAEAAIRAFHDRAGMRVWSGGLLSMCLRRQGRPEEAVPLLRRILTEYPGRADIWGNLGGALTDLLRLREAEQACRRAVALEPMDGSLVGNLGRTLSRLGRMQEALDCFDEALRLGLQNPAAIRWDRALVLLAMGRYAEGWPDYEARWGLAGLRKPSPPADEWDGQPAPDQMLLLWTEQGFGDAIQNMRYLPMVAQRVREVLVGLPPELVPLLGQDLPNVRAVPRSLEPGKGMLHRSILDMPALFSASPAEVPSRDGYLRAPAASLAAIRPLLGKRDGIKVGIVWSGSTEFPRNAERRASLDRFLQYFDQPGVQLVSLQKGPPAAELSGVARRRVLDLAPHLRSFADTAAACELLDLVIMTDSATAHLAGALGRPVWVLLGSVQHWPWALHGRSTPWYRSVRLYRQPFPGSWDEPFDAAAADLAALATARATMETR